MLCIAGQTAGQIGLIFCVDTYKWTGCYRLKNSKLYFQHFFQILFHGFFLQLV